MSQPYIGEIRLFAGNFAPNGWAFCNGALLPISENDALFALIGTMYGGDGQNTFGLPDLRGRVPVHFGTTLGNTVQQGEMFGVEQVTLTVPQIPNHNHALQASTQPASRSSPSGNTLAQAEDPLYVPTGSAPVDRALAPASATGGSQPHENRQPYLAINFIISLFGIFPSQN